MDNDNSGYNDILDEATVLYGEAKQIEAALATLGSSTVDDWINEGIAIEAAENKKLCDRLDGFFAAWKQISAGNCIDKYHNELRGMLKRIRNKRTASGYHASIFMAVAKGDEEISRSMQQAVRTSRKAAWLSFGELIPEDT